MDILYCMLRYEKKIEINILLMKKKLWQIAKDSKVIFIIFRVLSSQHKIFRKTFTVIVCDIGLMASQHRMNKSHANICIFNQTKNTKNPLLIRPQPLIIRAEKVQWRRAEVK